MQHQFDRIVLSGVLKIKNSIHVKASYSNMPITNKISAVGDIKSI